MTRLPTGRSGQVLAVLLMLLVLAAAWAAVGSPLLAWHAEREDALDRRALLARRMTQIAAGLPALEAQAQANKGAGPAPVAVLQGSSDAVAGAALQQKLQDMAAQAGATLSSTEALPPQPGGGYRLIGVRASVSAPWPNLVGLLLAVAESQPQLLVDDLQIHGARGFIREGGTPLDASFAVLGFRAGPTGP